MPLKTRKKTDSVASANIQFKSCSKLVFFFKVEWPKKEKKEKKRKELISSDWEEQFVNMHRWLKCKFFFSKKVEKIWKAMKVCEEECKVWTDLHFILSFFNSIEHIRFILYLIQWKNIHFVLSSMVLSNYKIGCKSATEKSQVKTFIAIYLNKNSLKFIGI